MLLSSQEPQESKDQIDGVLDNIESAVEANIVKFAQDQEQAEHTVITSKPILDDKETSFLRITLWSIAVVMLLVLIITMMIYG